MTNQPGTQIQVYIGTFTAMEPHGRGRAGGMYIARLDPDSGELTSVQTVPGVDNPSFVTLDPGQRHLYAVNEVPEYDGHSGGSVSAFAIDPATGGLTYLGRQPTRGAGPCHMTIDDMGRWVLAANYDSGSVAMFGVAGDGRLGPPTDLVQHEGAGSDPERQQGPHAHSVNLDPDCRFALVADLGLDRIMVYHLDRTRGRLVPNDPPFTETRPGAGPRHLDFHPNGRYVYVINELDSTLVAYEYDGERGTLSEVETVSTLPEGFAGTNGGGEVHAAASGRFVYGSNRGHDSIVVFAIDEASGRMTYVGHRSTRGRTPRHFGLDPTGSFLFAANQDTDTIVTFRVDTQTGCLTPTGHVREVPTPVCIGIRQSKET